MQWIRHSTATAVLLGPFQDPSDGTPETGLTVTAIDVDLYKTSDTHPLAKVDLTITATGGANDMAHVANGVYSLELTATDTGTLGRLRVTANVSGALPVWEDFLVVSANVYDAMVANSDKLQVDVNQWAGVAATRSSSTDLPEVDAKAISDSTAAADNVQANISRLDATVASRAATADLTLRTGTAVGGTSSTIEFNAFESSTNDVFNGGIIAITAGNGDGQTRRIVDYDGTTKIATVEPDWVVTPSGSSDYVILPGGFVDLLQQAKSAVNAEMDTAIADANLHALVQIAGNINDPTPSNNTFEGDATLSDTDDFYNGQVLVFTSGTLAGLGRRIDGYTGSTKNIVLENAFPTAPANGDTFSIIGIESSSAVGGGGGGDSDHDAIRTGTIAASPTPTSTSLASDDLSETTADFWNNKVVQITSGDANGLTARIIAFDPVNDQVTLAPALAVTPTAGDNFKILRQHAEPADWADTEKARVLTLTDKELNKRTHAVATGVTQFFDQAGTFVVHTETPSESGGVITVTPS